VDAGFAQTAQTSVVLISLVHFSHAKPLHIPFSPQFMHLPAHLPKQVLQIWAFDIFFNVVKVDKDLFLNKF
jgi:hypothetical protein